LHFCVVLANQAVEKSSTCASRSRPHVVCWFHVLQAFRANRSAGCRLWPPPRSLGCPSISMGAPPESIIVTRRKLDVLFPCCRETTPWCNGFEGEDRGPCVFLYWHSRLYNHFSFGSAVYLLVRLFMDSSKTHPGSVHQRRVPVLDAQAVSGEQVVHCDERYDRHIWYIDTLIFS
jgi:hypothetical protein